MSSSSKAINFLNSELLTNDHVYANFPMIYALEEPRYGYVNDSLHVVIQRKPNEQTTLAMISDPGSYDVDISEENGFKMIKMFKDPTVKFTLYRKVE